jgi:hypothetical protein
MGLAGFMLGTVGGQLAGASVYWRTRGSSGAPTGEFRAAAAAGVVTTLVASALFVLLGVHRWIGGEGTHWGASVFLGLCVGIVQGVLGRGRPLSPRSPVIPPSK